MNTRKEEQNQLERLLEIMRSLRDPEHGCPWDRAQTLASIVPHTLEEAYELVEAIESGDRDSLRDELGDLLFQVVFYAQIAAEQDWFDFAAIVAGLSDKLERRHPHVFGEQAGHVPVDRLNQQWEAIKKEERRGKGDANDASVLAAVSNTLPAMVRARKLQKRAATVGFDWPETGPVLAKVEEELDELSAELAGDVNRERIEEEFGDFLFACVNLARHIGVNPETALRRANRKFETRFRYIEEQLRARGRNPDTASLEEMDALWDEAKRHEERE
jgi:nucleoside triphosphate diphosphatase